MASSIQFGTCSWNYKSWTDLVYSSSRKHAADYLTEYGKKFPTVEIDSWFYKIPTSREVESYLEVAGKDLTFACKLFSGVTLTHHRSTKGNSDEINDDFLSVKLFNHYVDEIKSMHSRLVAIELEFEYLNQQKMPSLDVFLKALDTFFGSIDADHKVPLAVETRNGNYLHEEYFSLLKKWGVSHVFSEKMYMPHIYEVYEKFGDHLTDNVIIRLLGGDRKKIEEKTKGEWNRLVEEKADLQDVVSMLKQLKTSKKNAFVYVNNHYEGSAPLTIERIKALF